jgi:hypothetical protein
VAELPDDGFGARFEDSFGDRSELVAGPEDWFEGSLADWLGVEDCVGVEEGGGVEERGAVGEEGGVEEGGGEFDDPPPT